MNEIYRECMYSIGRAAFRHMCEELVRVQPINIEFKALINDPLCNMMMSNFVARHRGEPLPFPYPIKK